MLMYGAGSGEREVVEESEVAPGRSNCSGGGGNNSSSGPAGETGTKQVTKIRTRSNLETFIKNSSDPVKVKLEAFEIGRAHV